MKNLKFDYFNFFQPFFCFLLLSAISTDSYLSKVVPSEFHLSLDSFDSEDFVGTSKEEEETFFFALEPHRFLSLFNGS